MDETIKQFGTILNAGTVLVSSTSADSLNRKAVELDGRLRRRLELLDQQTLMSTKPPLILTAALVLPIDMLENDLPAGAPIHATETNTTVGVSRWVASCV